MFVDVVFLWKLKSFMRTISKRAIFHRHCAHTLSSADIFLPPILLPEKQNKNRLLIFTLVNTKCQTKKKLKLQQTWKQLGLNLSSLE